MSNETLFTFVVDSVPSCTRVDLFGSWDNFATAYPMKKDSRGGRGHWTGCHRYRDIICDGNLQKLTQRDGCLLAGGTYWYYYKRDDLVEFHNAEEPYTSACPLLPGQILNVLELPREDARLTDVPELNSGTDLDTFTLDPAMRFQNPKPWTRPLKQPVTVDRSSESILSLHTSDGEIWTRAVNAMENPSLDISEEESSLTLPSDVRHQKHLSERPRSAWSDVSSRSDAARSHFSQMRPCSGRPQSRRGLQSTWKDQPLSAIKTSGVLLSYVQALATFSIDRLSHHHKRPHTSSCISERPEYKKTVSRSRTATIAVSVKRRPGISQQRDWGSIAQGSRREATERSSGSHSSSLAKIHQDPFLDVIAGLNVSKVVSLGSDNAHQPDEKDALGEMHHRGKALDDDLEFGAGFSPSLSFPADFSDASSQSTMSCGFDRLGSGLSNTASTASSPAIYPIAACIGTGDINDMTPTLHPNYLLPETDCRFESQETIVPSKENNVGSTAPLVGSRPKERITIPPPPSRDPPPPPLKSELPPLEPGIGHLDLSLVSWKSLDA